MTQATSRPVGAKGLGQLDTAMDCGVRLMDLFFENLSANFDYLGRLVRAGSPYDAIEITSNHMRDRFESFTERMEEIAELARLGGPEAESEKASFFE